MNVPAFSTEPSPGITAAKRSTSRLVKTPQAISTSASLCVGIARATRAEINGHIEVLILIRKRMQTKDFHAFGIRRLILAAEQVIDRLIIGRRLHAVRPVVGTNHEFTCGEAGRESATRVAASSLVASVPIKEDPLRAGSKGSSQGTMVSQLVATSCPLESQDRMHNTLRILIGMERHASLITDPVTVHRFIMSSAIAVDEFFS